MNEDFVPALFWSVRRTGEHFRMFIVVDGSRLTSGPSGWTRQRYPTQSRAIRGAQIAMNALFSVAEDHDLQWEIHTPPTVVDVPKAVLEYWGNDFGQRRTNSVALCVVNAVRGLPRHDAMGVQKQTVTA